MQKGRNRGTAKGGDYVAYGEIAIFTKENGFITSNQIESARVTITRKIRKAGKLWIRVFPDKPLTKKPAETRQGKGKGNVELWVAPVKRGRILFELGGADKSVALEAFRLASYKLPVKTGVKER
jgi:large subunit ribosomal protein L16